MNVLTGKQSRLLHEFASVQLPFFLYKVGSINSLFLGVFMFLNTNYNDFTVSVLSFIPEGIRSRILGVSRFFSPWNVKWGSASFLCRYLHWPWLQLCKSHIANSITWCFKQIQKIDINVQYSRLMMAILQFVLINRCSFLNSASQLRMGSYRINLQSYLAEASGYYVLQKLTFLMYFLLILIVHNGTKVNITNHTILAPRKSLGDLLSSST